jgi:hypothetical protein
MHWDMALLKSNDKFRKVDRNKCTLSNSGRVSTYQGCVLQKKYFVVINNCHTHASDVLNSLQHKGVCRDYIQ